MVAADGSSSLAPLDSAGAPNCSLHVHPNTLDYRLRRIAELTGRRPRTAPGLSRCAVPR